MKKYIAERNARDGAAGSGFGVTEASPTPAVEAPRENAAQDGVDN